MPDNGFGKIFDDARDGNDRVGVQKVFVFDYDFTVDGGAVGNITLRGPKVPPNAMVVNSLFVPGKVNLVTTNNDGTLALALEGAGDLMATSAAINANLDETLVLIPDFATAGDYKTTTVARSVVATIATDAITAGDFRVYLWVICPGDVPAT